jgi:glutathione synthase
VDQTEYESMKQFMIMEKINPPMIKAWMLKDGTINEVESLSELGLYSFIMIDTDKKDDNLIHNENTGTLMRTKGSHSNEGGVNAGFAVIDAPILYFEESGKVEAKINPNVSEMKE